MGRPSEGLVIRMTITLSCKEYELLEMLEDMLEAKNKSEVIRKLIHVVSEDLGLS